MTIEHNGKIYETPQSFEVKVRDGEERKVLKLRFTRQEYYAEVYGNGEHIELNKLISAALGREVELELLRDSDGLVAKVGDEVRVVIAKAKAKNKKKKKAEVVEATTVEANLSVDQEEDPQSE